MSSGMLYICATPIGNLSDVTERLLTTLKSVDYILAEDTRVTLKLLSRFGSEHPPLISFPAQASNEKRARVIEEILSGKSYALVSDAGTPAVSDPGADLVVEALAQGIQVVPIVGPSAVTALMSVMGERYPEFHFWGFFPIKNKKVREMKEWILSVPGAHLFFESPFRVLKTLQEHFWEWDDFMCVVGREMTKKFETFYRGTPREVVEQLKSGIVKGEFVVGLVRKTRKKGFAHPENDED